MTPRKRAETSKPRAPRAKKAEKAEGKAEGKPARQRKPTEKAAAAAAEAKPRAAPRLRKPKVIPASPLTPPPPEPMSAPAEAPVKPPSSSHLPPDGSPHPSASSASSMQDFESEEGASVRAEVALAPEASEAAETREVAKAQRPVEEEIDAADLDAAEAVLHLANPRTPPPERRAPAPSPIPRSPSPAPSLTSSLGRECTHRTGTARVAIRSAPRSLVAGAAFGPGDVVMSEPPLMVADDAAPDELAGRLGELAPDKLYALLSAPTFAARTAIEGVFAANSVPAGDGYAALGVGSYAEHSCAPNAGFTYCDYCGDIRELVPQWLGLLAVLVAHRHIAQGEAITASRWSPATLCRRTTERQAAITWEQGHACACGACANPSLVSDFRREEVRHCLKMLDERPLLELAAGGERVLEQIMQAAAAAEEEGLAEVLPRLCEGAFFIHAAWGHDGEAEVAAQSAAGALRRVRGRDAVPPTHVFEVWARDPRSWELYGAALDDSN
ncbi:uncharacterized protein LOC62_01G000305 [Vanrija pseudolonga]|uniref:SET domain-containing protein n=1 Tax=Vanrija pseudolonga TaxID=143232 RepID=A0AAF0Y054_9TREE|nr:hypothetical protein LOC62_01G000305 [Vanrija pseudolonga]